MCGRKNEKPIYKKWWFYVVIFTWLLIFSPILTNPQDFIEGFEEGYNAGRYGETYNPPKALPTQTIKPVSTPKPTAKPTAKPKFEITSDITVEKDAYWYYLEGIVKNNTNDDYSYVQITFILYDAEGNTIGSAVGNINGLKSGSTWKFKAIGLIDDPDEVARYELSEIIGW